jgi:hypothetical protein
MMAYQSFGAWRSLFLVDSLISKELSIELAEDCELEQLQKLSGGVIEASWWRVGSSQSSCSKCAPYTADTVLAASAMDPN